MWDGQMLFLPQNRFRVIAQDRRGHSRSSHASNNNEMNGYADDLATAIETLDLTNVTVVGDSTGDDRPQFYRDFVAPFFGANRPGAKVSQGCRVRRG
jgi:pimeloyl-ACP methyl ester carboxylesterase